MAEEKEVSEAAETARETDIYSQSYASTEWRKLFYIEPRKRNSIIKIAVGGILSLLLFSMVINSYVQLNEVYSQISAAQTTLSDLQSENVRMRTELEGQASIRNIKEYAEERLGLIKLERSQIQYIQIQTEDQVTVEEPEQNIFVRIKRKFNDLIAYLRG